MSTNIKIARASFVLMAANVIYLAAGIAREMVVASRFGVSRQMDAFFAAITIPDAVNNIVLGTLSAVFIPIYIRSSIGNKNEADAVSSTITNLILLALLAVNIVIFTGSTFISGLLFGGFSVQTSALTAGILRILSFTVVFSGLSAMLISLLNAKEYFFVPAASNIFRPLMTMGFVLLLSYSLGVKVLALGLIAGILLQITFLLPALKRTGYRHSWRIDIKNPAVKEAFFSASIFLIAMATAHLNVIIDRVMASYLVAGSIAALNYADRIVQVPTMIISGAIAGAVLPFFSQQAASGNYSGLKDSFAKSITMAGLIFLPATAAMLIFAEPFIRLMYERGAFNSQATVLTSVILSYFSLQLFFFTTVLIMGKVCLALNKIKTVALIAVFSFLLKIVLNLLFMKLIDPPVAGIALASSLVYMTAMVVYFAYLKKILLSLGGLYILTGLARIIAATAIMGAVMLYLSRLSLHFLPGVSLLSKIVQLAAPAAAGAAVFYLSALLFKVDEINKLKYFIFQRPDQAL